LKERITFIPAIDLMNGKCVRLTQGKKDSMVVYSEDPAGMARKWEQAGAERLHVIDLDGAFNGRPCNTPAIRQIRDAVSMKIEIGGGIRTPEEIANYINMGIDSVILGTRAIRDREWLQKQLNAYRDHIIIGLDAKDGFLTSHGWTVTEDIIASSFALDLEEMGLETIIYTDVKRDGMLTGPNLNALSTIAHTVGMNVIASGGIHTLEDIRNIVNLEIDNITGIISGKALYEGTLDIREALSECRPPVL